MLRIRMLSGEDVASIPVGEVIDVRAMKQRLNALHGLPNRFRQRLICQGSPLDDSATLSSPADLELVLLPHSDATETQVVELVTAAAKGSTTEVETMLRLPQNPNIVGSQGRSALTAASHEGNVEVLRLLLEAGADKNMQTTDGDTALILASAGGRLESVHLLLNAGADKNACDNDGFTALAAAAEFNSLSDIVRLLLDAGADVNLASKCGTTALMLASQQGQLETVRLLLDARADLNSATDDGFTAVMLARLFCRWETVTLLQDVGADRIARKRPQSPDLNTSKRRRGSSATAGGADGPGDA
ncbi:unnamed protein product [Symbiodinium sp. KB8]|nr:unnamed protein product [Symbiodinium sp. KB8]